MSTIKRFDFLLKEIQDPYVQENFYRLKLWLDELSLGGTTATGPQGPPGPQGPAGDSGTDYIILEGVTCDASVATGKVVRMTGGGTAVNALADIPGNSNMMGICIAKTATTVANIQVSGITPALYAGLDVTKDYFLSTSSAGDVTNVVPSGSGEMLVKVGRPFSASRLLILNNLRQRRA
jgi:hypothetical protein